MDYPFENLDPERFQKFSQALLVREFPNVQCFPVGQPDGGRDALRYFSEDDSRGFIMYQVKFVRKPLAESDPHKWLLETMQGEGPKLQAQVPKGAKQYILLTNIQGTAHSESGSIDKLNQLLSEQLNVPVQCWWRDDLSRRLDDAWNLKWIYPELMTGPDLIRSVIESGLSEGKERRTAAIRAYVTHQFDMDQKVKFKQVELENRLFDLFIDVPVLPPTGAARETQYIYQAIHRQIIRDITSRRRSSSDSLSSEDGIPQFITGSDFFPGRDEANMIGAAAMLLHPVFQTRVPYVVLEGAPGQGKSTVTQYICQVHRMQILGREQVEQLIPEQYRGNEVFEKLPEEHKTLSIRLPFRVDLRDLAVWLAKRNPFSAEKQDDPHPKWNKSLESFLSAQIENDSGGFEFSVADLHSVAKLSSVLLVFDGLDEVADIEKRREVVKEIVSGVNRLKSNAASLQVIVTSRPAAFANSPGLPEENFPYYHLGAVTRSLIDEYAKKWMRARRLDNQQVKDVKKVLQEKLDQPHLRDLARNPMQLTILLSLIRTKTASLPDKRTALYDSYISLFFDREAEKHPVVRTHRDLLIDIHRYLAWVLHVEAEEKDSGGRITQENLRRQLSEYLVNEGYQESLVDELLLGMVERVVALVSRVEGTYEFEVQPLREYFAAKYLYETAPQSPPGNEKSGTKPDRFDAISRNFYWLNVTRFYAGCYSKGELADLIERLEELVSENGYSLISHPRLLASVLLSDYVFSQQPKSVRRVIQMIMDGIGLRYLLSSNSRRLGSGNPLVLPKACGQDELITHCFAILRNMPPKDYALDVIDLIKANAPSEEVDTLWRGAVLSQKGIAQTHWLEYGLYFGSLSKLSLPELDTVLADGVNNPQSIEILFRARRFDYFELDEKKFNTALESILDRRIAIADRQPLRSVLDLASRIVDVERYSVVLNASLPIPLFKLWNDDEFQIEDRNFFLSSLNREQIQNAPDFTTVASCYRLLESVESQAQKPLYVWATELLPWDNLVETARSIFGDKWAFFNIANISAGIISKSETCTDFPELFNQSKSLCRRARYARLRSGTISYWQKVFNQASSSADVIFATLLVVTWGSQKTLESLISVIDSHIEALSVDDWQSLYEAIEEAFSLTQHLNKRYITFNVGSFPEKLNARTITILSIRATNKIDFYRKYPSDNNETDPLILQYWQSIAVELLSERKIKWETALDMISKSYMKGAVSERYAFQRFIRRVSVNSLPEELAKDIARQPDHYPGFLVAVAEAKCRDIVASQITKVGEIARKDKWFDN